MALFNTPDAETFWGHLVPSNAYGRGHRPLEVRPLHRPLESSGTAMGLVTDQGSWDLGFWLERPYPALLGARDLTASDTDALTQM